MKKKTRDLRKPRLLNKNKNTNLLSGTLDGEEDRTRKLEYLLWILRMQIQGQRAETHTEKVERYL